MPVITNGAAATNALALDLTGGVAHTFNYTCPVGTNCLVIFEAGNNDSVALTAPTAVSYNGVAATVVPGSFFARTLNIFAGCSIWYLLNPTADGSAHSVSLTYAEIRQRGEYIVVPLSGVSTTTPVGTAVSAIPGNGDTYSITAAGGGLHDLYIGGIQVFSPSAVTFTPAGTGQTKLAQVVSRSAETACLDTIPGGNPGAFSWTTAGVGSYGVSSAVAFLSTDPRDSLKTGVNTDLVLYNQNWNYASAASTNFILVGTTGAFCNNQSGAQEVFATWQGQQFSADQAAQITLVSFVSGAQAGPCVRASNGAAGPNGYVVFFDAAHYNIGKLVNGGFTSLTGGQQARSSNPGDIVLLQVQGTTITVFINGVTLTQVTDSTWASGSPGIAFTGVHPSTVISTFIAGSLGILVPPYALTGTIGQLGFKLSVSPTQQTATYSQIGNITTNQTVMLTAETATFAEGQLVDFLSIFGQTATFVEGSLTSAVTGGATVNLGAQSIGGVVGILADGISYILDQNAIIVIGQTATFSEGLINFTPTYSFSSYTITDTNGTILSEVDTALIAQSITSSEGLIVATTGTTTSVQLTPQNVVSSEGLTSSLVIIDPVTGQTLTSAEGMLTFSNTGNFLATLAGQFGSFISGSIALNIIPVAQSGYPNLAGLILEDATQRLEVAGAIVPASIGYFGTWPITVNWVPSQVPPFVVLSQSIPPAAPIVPNAPILLVVSQPNESVAYP